VDAGKLRRIRVLNEDFVGILAVRDGVVTEASNDLRWALSKPERFVADKLRAAGARFEDDEG